MSVAYKDVYVEDAKYQNLDFQSTCNISSTHAYFLLALTLFLLALTFICYLYAYFLLARLFFTCTLIFLPHAYFYLHSIKVTVAKYVKFIVTKMVTHGRRADLLVFVSYFELYCFSRYTVHKSQIIANMSKILPV